MYKICFYIAALSIFISCKHDKEKSKCEDEFVKSFIEVVDYVVENEIPYEKVRVTLTESSYRKFEGSYFLVEKKLSVLNNVDESFNLKTLELNNKQNYSQVELCGKDRLKVFDLDDTNLPIASLPHRPFFNQGLTKCYLELKVGKSVYGYIINKDSSSDKWVNHEEIFSLVE